LSAFASTRFAFGRVPCQFPPVYLLRLAAAKVRSQRFSEAKALGGFARTGCTRQNRICALRHRPVIGAGQAHDFAFQEASPNSPRLRWKDGAQAAGGRAESLVERHGGQGKARICGAQGLACRIRACHVGGSHPVPRAELSHGLSAKRDRSGKRGTGSLQRARLRKYDTAVIRKKLYMISNAYAWLANPPRIIRARSSRRVLLASRSHRITLPGS
jgi:hypothetical protein